MTPRRLPSIPINACGASGDRLHRLQDFGGVPRYLDLSPDTSNDPFTVDEEGAALDAHVFSPVQALFDPRAVALHHIAVLVRGEQGREAILGPEPAVPLHRVLGHPH